MKRANLYYASVILNIVLIFLIGHRLNYNYSKLFDFRDNSIENDLIYKRTKEARTKLIAKLPNENGSIVFLGNSLTENFPVQEIFSSLKVKNRGVSGNTSSDIIRRLDIIVESKPEKIFLMDGINDIYRDHRSVDETFLEFKKIINIITTKSPSTKLYIQSVLPVWGEGNINEKIKKYNSKIKEFCQDNNLIYIDLYSYFLKDGEMNSALTTDGMHLNEKGYFIWKNRIEQYVK